jgi:tetratricopeptide (TPR) repeat protein
MVVHFNRWSAYTRRRDYNGVYPYWKEDVEQAIADFEAALRLDPNNAGARKQLEAARRMAVGGPPLPPPGPLPPDIYGDDEPPPPGW